MGNKRGASPHPGVELLKDSDEHGEFPVGRWFVPELGKSGKERRRKKKRLRISGKAIPDDLCTEWAMNLSRELLRMEIVADSGRRVPPHEITLDPQNPVYYIPKAEELSALDIKELVIGEAKFLYGVRCMGNVKIGISNNPNSRLSALQTGCPVPMEIEFAVHGMAWAEKDIHRFLAPERVQGEWFSGPLTLSVVSVMRQLDASSRMSEQRLIRYLKSRVSEAKAELDDIKKGKPGALGSIKQTWLYPRVAKKYASQETPCP